jgi:multiple antibiotic resistance protein
MNAPLISLFQNAFVVFATLTPIINAPGMAPIFLGLTEGVSHADRSRMARQIALSGLLLVMGSVLVGSHLLAFFGVSIPALRLGGGLLVIATAWIYSARKIRDPWPDRFMKLRPVRQPEPFRSFTR